MSLYCVIDADTDNPDWWWHEPANEAPLVTKRWRKCCSCGEKLKPGQITRKIARYRAPSEFEERFNLDEVPLADWYLCEICGDLADSLKELNFCYTLGDGVSLKKQIADYRKDEAA